MQLVNIIAKVFNSLSWYNWILYKVAFNIHS